MLHRPVETARVCGKFTELSQNPVSRQVRCYGVNEGSIRSLLDSRGVVDFAKMIAWNPETRLRNVFAKALHKGHVRNAELSPPAPEHIASLLSLGEKCIVVVRDKKQRLLWVTDRRLLMEDGPAVSELFVFSAVERVHWMARENRFQLSKSDNFDRLEIDLMSGETREVILDELDQAVFPLLSFLQRLARKRLPDVEPAIRNL